MIIYTDDPQNPVDAYFAEQDPDNLDKWTVYQMPGYGVGYRKKLIYLCGYMTLKKEITIVTVAAILNFRTTG